MTIQEYQDKRLQLIKAYHIYDIYTMYTIAKRKGDSRKIKQFHEELVQQFCAYEGKSPRQIVSNFIDSGADMLNYITLELKHLQDEVGRQTPSNNGYVRQFEAELNKACSDRKENL